MKPEKCAAATEQKEILHVSEASIEWINQIQQILVSIDAELEQIDCMHQTSMLC